MGSHLSTIPGSETLNPQVAQSPNAATYWVLWWYFGVFACATVLFSILTFRKPMHERTNGYIAIWTVAVSMCSYYVLACHAGSSLIPLYWNTSEARSVPWARYIAWTLSTPALLLSPLIVAAVPWGLYLWIFFADVFMILFGLWGAITTWHFRWGYFAIGCVFLFIVYYGMLVQGPRYAARRHPKLKMSYTFLAWYLMILYTIYPIVWGLSEGANVLSSTAEAAWYGALDILNKIVQGLVVLLIVQPRYIKILEEERSKGIYDISLLDAPVTAPLSGVRQRLPASTGYTPTPGPTVNVDVYPERTGDVEVVAARGQDGHAA